MGEPLTDSVLQAIHQASNLYHRLVLLVAPSGSGKTATLHDVRRRVDAPLINVNLELSLRLLEMTSRQRAVLLPRVLGQIVTLPGTDLVLMDNLEILFDPKLRQDPIRLLQGLSRHRTLVAAWFGSADQDRLEYAAPDHPEYRRYPVRDFLVVSPGFQT